MSTISPETRERNRQRERKRYHEDPATQARAKARSRAQYWADPETDKLRTKDWNHKNPDRRRDTALKHSHKRNRLPEATRPRPTHCEICGGLQNGRGRLHLDHCHFTGIFRGWICSRCNLGLGAFGDGVGGLRSAIAYLERAYAD